MEDTGLPNQEAGEWGEACIHELAEPEEAEALGEAEAPAEAAAPAQEDDGYAPDDELGSGDPAGPLLRYDGGDWLEGLPTRADLIAEQDGAETPTTAALRAHLDAGRTVFFMPTDIEETNEYQGGLPVYTLRLFGALMDGSKADVSVTGVRVFFDVRVPADAPADAPPGNAPGGGPAGKPAGPKGERGGAGSRADLFDAHLRQLLADAGVLGARFEAVEAYPGRGYHEAPVAYKRVTTANLQQRKKAIAAVRAAGYETASDDRSNYYRKAARESSLPLSDWAALSGYEHSPGYTDRSPLCAHVLRVPVEGYRPLVDPLAAKEKREAGARVKARAPLLARDRTLVLAWDIETHSDRKAGDLPRAAHDGDQAFMVCLTAHWKDDAAPLRRFCLVDVEAAPDRRWTTVVCGSPQNVLRAFALVWRALAPDVCAGFNDSDYDWPFVVEKARKWRLLAWMWGTMTASPRRTATDESVYRWNYRQDQKIKISSEESFLSSYLKVPGCVPIDVRVCYKKLFPKSETPKAGSLKFYLEVSGLAGKADMPFQRMWRYYEAARAARAEGAAPAAAAEAAERMRHVAHYCVIDALRCQQLLVRRNIINDYREVSALASLGLADSHYYATGMKVCNLLGAYSWQRNMLVSMVPGERQETGKYPGAYVFPPEKGLTPDPDRLAAVEAAADALRKAVGPTAAGAVVLAEAARVDAAAAPEKAELAAKSAESALAAAAAIAAWGADPQEAARLTAALTAALQAFVGDRPVTGLDFASLYPSLIMTYNLSPEKILLTAAEAEYWRARGKTLHPIEFLYNGRVVRGWSIRHNNVPEDIGLYPAVLIDLFNKRAEVKVHLAAHGAVKELIEVAEGRAKKDGLSLVGALRLVGAEAEAEQARTEAALAPGAPPPRISPGSTLADELADLRRLGRNAREAAAEAARLLALAGPDADDAATEAAVRGEYERASFAWVGANSKQNGLKVLMNSFYGETGNALSPFFLLPLAGGVTSAGQYNIKLVAAHTDEAGFRKKYGDSVTGDTALVVRHAGVIRTARIDELVPEDGWAPYGDKEAAAVPGLEVWQDGGFTAVDRVIRHACDKPIMRVLTHTGVVDCTTDHSLLRPDGSEARPVDVKVGDPLLHAADRNLIRALDSVAGDGISEDEAFAMGLFAADGSCGVYRNAAKRTVKYTWAINNLDLALLAKAALCLPFPTKTLNTVGSSGVYKLVPVGDIKGPTLRYRALFYNENRGKRVPPEILGAELDIALAFWFGFYAGDGDRAQQMLQTNWRIDQKGKEMCTGLWLLGRRLGWEVSLNDRADKPEVFRMTFSDAQARKRPLWGIKKIRPLGVKPGYVYDLETASHHFHVGPGDLVVHNTDSLYLTASPRYFAECDAEFAAGRLNREGWFEAMVRVTMRALNAIRDDVNAFLKRDNGSPYLKMAYEEVLYPVVFTGKKKYWGVPHLNEVNFRPKKLFIRGIDVVKQGQSGLAREIGYRIMWACMALDNTRTLRQIVEDVLREAVLNGEQWGFDHFVQTDAWKPHKDNKAVHRFIARMRARLAVEAAENARLLAEGGAPKPSLYELPEPGERFSYVIAKAGATFSLRGTRAALKKGDRMEFARSARALGLTIDVAYYMVSYVVGLCARFINGEAQFQPAPSARLDEKAVDKKAQDAAKKYLGKYIQNLTNLDSKTLMRRGYAYRRAYGAAAVATREALVARVGAGAADVLHGPWLDFEVLAGGGAPEGADDDGDEAEALQDSTTAVVESLWRAAGALADATAAADEREWCEALGRELGIAPDGSDAGEAAHTGLTSQRAGQGPGPAATKRPATKLFAASPAAARRRPAGGAAVSTSSLVDRMEATVRAELAALAPAAEDVAARYEADLARLVHLRRLDEHGAHPEIGLPEAGEAALAAGASAPAESGDVLVGVTAADAQALLALRRKWFEAVGLQLTRRRNAQYAAHLHRLRDRRLGAPAPPSKADRARLVTEAAAKMRVSGEIEVTL